ncbi:MAG: hypothetical protein Q9174_003329, partial [Haloplaca sp. 1 TL-2023]
MFSSRPLATILSVVSVLGSALTSPTSNPPRYCSQKTVANYDDIQGAAVVAQPLSTPYKGLNYPGWLAVTNAQVGPVQGSVLQVQSPPTTIFFGQTLGQPAVEHSFEIGKGFSYYTLTSLYFACVTAPVGAVGLGGALGGVNVPLSCTIGAIGTKTNGDKVTTKLSSEPVLKQQKFTFPDTFKDLKKVEFILETTSVLSGLVDVDVDNVDAFALLDFPIMAEQAVQPVRNDSLIISSRWVPEPNGRGTWSLLSTCIITILLCVWSAVHLNVPQHEKQKLKYWRKCKWLLLGLFAPEVVAYVAWQQWREAKRLRDDVRALYGQDRIPSRLRRITRYSLSVGSAKENATEYNTGSPSPAPKVRQGTRSEWTIVHGFYALMGGYAFAPPGNDFLPNGVNRTTITPTGLRFLLEHEPTALPEITADEIRDKSKADGLKKTLVCVQALWFCAQCITRQSQSLPVSLLELNTVGHALCTLVIYLLWWHKPLDVDEPTLISNSKLNQMCAYMWMSSRVSASGHCTYDMPDGLQDEFHCIWPFSRPSLKDLELIRLPFPTRSYYQFDDGPQPNNGRAMTELGRPSYISSMYKLRQGIYLSMCPDAIKADRPAGLSIRKTAISRLSPVDLQRWSFAHMAISSYDLKADLLLRHSIATSGRTFIRSLNMRVPFVDALQNNNLDPRLEIRAPNAKFTVAASGLFPGFAVTGGLYGGLHLAAWNASFPSHTEKLAWRISSTSVTCTGAMLAILAWIANTEGGKRALLDFSRIITRKRLLDRPEYRITWARYVNAIAAGLM